MRQYSSLIAVALAGILFMATSPASVYAQASFTDFRQREYTAEDIAKALFPEMYPHQPNIGQSRGIRPPTQPLLPPPARPLSASPAAKPAVTINIHFATNSAEILPQYQPDLDKLGEVLVRHNQASLEIAGHTDSVGSDHTNRLLSERRAKSIKHYLVQNFSISEDRLIAKGYGESQPVDTNRTPQGRSVNRRVEVVRLAP